MNCANTIFDDAIYTIFKITPPGHRKAIVFNLKHKDVDTFLRRVLRPKLVHVERTDTGIWESDFIKYEAVADHNKEQIITLDFNEDSKNLIDENQWVD